MTPWPPQRTYERRPYFRLGFESATTHGGWSRSGAGEEAEKVRHRVPVAVEFQVTRAKRVGELTITEDEAAERGGVGVDGRIAMTLATPGGARSSVGPARSE
jgi:hypothetical protein